TRQRWLSRVPPGHTSTVSVRDRRGRQLDLAAALHVVVPRDRVLAVVDAPHRDAAVDGADERAEVAARAVVLEDPRHLDAALVGAVRLGDALVRAVPARDVAELAADALLRVDARDDLVGEVEVAPLDERGH